MAEYRYRIPAGSGHAELREKGSRFAAWIESVPDERSARAALDGLRRRHPDATHHCWAWRLGEPAKERSSDDGEPGGTAGVPMLQALRGEGLSDVLAVVVRWFGGTKLGKGGLARAYAGAVRSALEELPTGERFVYETLQVEMSYDRLGALQRLVHPPEVEMVEPVYGELVDCTIRVLPPNRESLLDALAAAGIRVKKRDP